MSGMWIWPFELKEKIGEGGMGLVYKARYVKDDRLFAIKLIPAEVTNKTLLARFEREIGILKTLRHPNIVRAFGGVCEDKQRFYAMELVEGGTVWDRIQQEGHLPWALVCKWGQQMCAALAYAHGKQIIHRDVKPNNFLITKKGQIKLSDFGLVSVMSEAKLTADGRTLGTVQYMSPEQIRGKPALTHSTDLYSLGIVLYECLTGRPPFTGDNPGPILHAHLVDPPTPITQTNPDCPAALERLVLSLLEKSPQNRPADADEVAEKLSQILAKPRLVESTTTSHRIGVSQAETPAELKSAFQIVEQSLKFVWVGLASLLVLLAVIWTLSLFRSEPGVELWVETLRQHPNTEVRIAAASAVGQLATTHDDLLEELIDISEDGQEQLTVRQEAIRQLGLNAAAANRYRSRIQKLAKSDPTELIRVQAIQTLSQLDQ